MMLKPTPRLLNAAGGGGGGFFSGIKLPFGMSNANPAPMVPNPNPAFPAKNQLDPKNNTLDPNNVNRQAGDSGEPNADPNNNADPNKGAPGSQLDSFKDLFTVPTDDKGQPQLPTDPMAGPLLAVNAEKLREAAGKMNFTAGVAPELLQKAMSGQDPQAFMDVLNTVAQGAFLQAMTVNAGVVETAFSRHSQRIDQALPGRIRSVQIGQSAPKHPALSHPAAAPMVAALKSQIASTNPHLTPEQVAEKAEGYVIAMASDITTHNTQQSNQNQNGSKQETDWIGLLSGTAQ